MRGQRNNGFSLVEVLVTMVVMSVGMLGIAALYLEGLRAGRTALNRTTAVTLAADMADRIRANSSAGAAYAGNGPGIDNDCINGASNCTASELANDDWFTWRNELAAQLPEGSAGQIEVVGPAPDTYTITVAWPEIGQDDPATYTLSIRP